MSDRGAPANSRAVCSTAGFWGLCAASAGRFLFRSKAENSVDFPSDDGGLMSTDHTWPCCPVWFLCLFPSSFFALMLPARPQERLGSGPTLSGLLPTSALQRRRVTKGPTPEACIFESRIPELVGSQRLSGSSLKQVDPSIPTSSFLRVLQGSLSPLNYLF